MKAILLAVVLLSAGACLSAEALTEWEIADLKAIHRERLADWLKDRIGDDALLSWKDLNADIKATGGRDWNDLTKPEQSRFLIRKMEKDAIFQEKIEKAFSEWKKQRK